MSIKVMLIGSNSEKQQLLESRFGQEGFEVSSYGDGLSALDVLASVNPDVILAEYNLAGMSVFRFCQKLQQKSGPKGRPLFLLIPSGEAVDQERLRSSGVVDFIQEPLKIEEALSKVRKHTGGPGAPIPKTASGKQTESVLPSTEEDREGEKIEELLGWSTAGEKQTASPPKEPQVELKEEPKEAPSREDDRTLIADPSVAAFSEEAKRGSGEPKQPEPAGAEDQTIMVSPEGLSPGAGDLGSGKTPPALEPPPDEVTVVASAESMLVPGTMADLTERPIAPEKGIEEKSAGTAPVEGSPPSQGVQPAAQTPSPEMVETTVSKMAREIIEKVAWEVVPTIAEALIKEELEKLKSDKSQ